MIKEKLSYTQRDRDRERLRRLSTATANALTESAMPSLANSTSLENYIQLNWKYLTGLSTLIRALCRLQRPNKRLLAN